MDEMISVLGSSRYFTTFDLSKGFHQIVMKESDKIKTGFISHRGLMQFNRLPMGLKNSPATFQRMLDTLLKEFKGKFCGIFFDDFVIYSNSFEDHLEHLTLVLEALSKAGLTVNPKKVQLCTQK